MIIKKGEPKFKGLMALVNAASNQYRKHSIIVTISDSVELQDTHWSGGTRSTYTLVDTRRMGAIRRFPQYAPPQFGGPPTVQTYTLAPNQAVIDTGLFCGNVATASVTLSQSDFDALC
jgi:hypothetical protein